MEDKNGKFSIGERTKIERLDADGLRLEGILITHHHPDHQGGIEALAARWQPAVYAPAGESITGRTHPLHGGERIDVLGESVAVMAVPGHTLGHLAYHLPGVLFCGDTLFYQGYGRVDLAGGSEKAMMESLTRLMKLPDDTVCYPGHGMKTKIAWERGTQA